MLVFCHGSKSIAPIRDARALARSPSRQRKRGDIGTIPGRSKGYSCTLTPQIEGSITPRRTIIWLLLLFPSAISPCRYEDLRTGWHSTMILHGATASTYPIYAVPFQPS
ncbi:hypothetical protein PM082_012637 [Marasmius tenuissimus]|nr:hypothetical protein PM082_012637 [Marasmius tenuissimus]